MKVNYLTSYKILFWGIIVVVMILAFTPGEYAVETRFSDKTNHLAAFGVLTVLGFRAFKKQYLKIVTRLLCFGVIIEVGQIWIPGRSCSILDIGADLCGIAFGLSIYFTINIIKIRLKKAT